MRLPFLRLPRVYHLGTMDLAERGSLHRSSQEGNGLSVSLCPRAWEEIARLGGSPLHRLSRPDAVFLDVLGMDGEAREAVGAWALAEGLAEEAVRYVAWRWDGEAEAWAGMTCPTREDALAELEDELDGDEPTEERLNIRDEDGPPGGSMLQEASMLVLTAEGDRRTLGYGRDGDAMGILPMLWAEDVLRPLLPDLVGAWWREEHAPEMLSSPRGAVFPSAVAGFDALDMGWRGVPSDENLLARMPRPRMLDVAVPGPRAGMAP